MTGYTVHTGSTVKFSGGWDRVFSGKKPGKTAAKPAKKPGKKSAAAKRKSAKKAGRRQSR